MPNLPSGTVTFVFTDLEGSTDLLKRLGDEPYREVLGTHRRLVRETFGAHDGHEIDTQGDAFFYGFPRARNAVAAAVAVQRSHATEAWPAEAAVLVRIGLHTGEPVVGEEGYTGLDVVRAARIAAVGRGGQTLLSGTTRAIVMDGLPPGVELHPLGRRRLKDIDRPEELYEVRIEGVPPADGGRALAPAPAAGSGAVERTRQQIEQRVLAEVERTIETGSLPPIPGLAGLIRRDAPPAPPRGPVSDEIAKLKELRDAGALSDEQYARAVDRVLDGDGSNPP